VAPRNFVLMVPGDLVRAGVAINHGRVALKMGAKNWRGRV